MITSSKESGVNAHELSVLLVNGTSTAHSLSVQVQRSDDQGLF